MASLFVIRGRDQGRRFELSDGLTLGRESVNAIQLHDTEVSRRHAQIRIRDGQFWLADLKSSNGSFLNDQRIDEHALRSGDRVQVGRTLMIFTSSDGGESDVTSGVFEDFIPIRGRVTPRKTVYLDVIEGG